MNSQRGLQVERHTVYLAHDRACVWTGLQPEQPGQHMTSVLYIHVEDADRLAADWRPAGAAIDGPGTRTTASARASTLTLTGT